MSKFKVGDEVRRIGGHCGSDMMTGAVNTVHKVGTNGSLQFFERDTFYMAVYYELAQSKYPNPPHVHADVIIEWAKGADIVWQRDYEKGTNVWRDKQSPGWHVENIYKVKTTQSKLADIKTQSKIDKYQAKIDALKLTLGDK